MVGTDDKDGTGRILFRLNNPSTLIIRAKVCCEFKVYGTSVNCASPYNGTEIWVSGVNSWWFCPAFRYKTDKFLLGQK